MGHENLQVEMIEGVAEGAGLAAGGEVEDSAEGEHEVEDPTEEEDDELEEDDVVQFAIGDYAVVQGAFATGFSSPGRTWPGHVIRSDMVEVVFEGVTVGGEKDFVTQAFENFYDWEDLMHMVLSAVDKRTISIEDMEEEIYDSFYDWLTTLEGWGLLSSVVHIQESRHFLMALLYTSANWVEATGGPRTNQKVFNSVKFIYDHIEGKSLTDMVPQYGVWFEEMEPRQKSTERTKRLVVFIKGQWDFEVKFSVAKRRKVGSSLLELAAEAVAEQVWKEEDIDTRKLEVAETLQDVLLENFHDLRWVRKHWGSSMKCPSQTLKDVGNSPKGKKLTAGEPLDFLEEEEMVLPGRQVEEVDEVEAEEGEVGIGAGWFDVNSKVDLEESAGDYMEPFDLAITTKEEHVEPTEACLEVERADCWAKLDRSPWRNLAQPGICIFAVLVLLLCTWWSS